MAFVSNYQNRYSLRSRGANAVRNGNGIITLTHNFPGGGEFAPWADAIDGNLGTSPVYSVNPVAGTTFVQFQFDQAFVCDGFLFIGGDTGTSFGDWKIQGSNNGSTWTDLTTFTYQLVANGLPANTYFPVMALHDGLEVTFTNTSAFSYYRMLNVVSPGSITKTFGDEILFRSNHSEYDGGNRTGSITVTTNMTEADGHAASVSVDGTEVEFNSGATTYRYPSLTAGTSYFAFEFPAAVLMRDSVWLQDQNGSAGAWGSWKWQRSDDGSTWTDEGSSFLFQDATLIYSARVIPSPGGTTAAKHWRILCTSGTVSNLSIFYETIFNLTEPPQSFMAAVETPDTFAGTGYVGAFGKVGDLTATEAKDTFSAAGYQPNNGPLIATEARDVFSAFGFQPQSAVMHATEAPDIFHGLGVGRGVDGVFITTEAVDRLTIIGDTPISGTFHTTEAADRFSAIGAGVIRVRRRRTSFVT